MNDTFKINKDFFANKNLLILGDSVSAQATIGNDKTYSTLLKEELNINELKNAKRYFENIKSIIEKLRCIK